MMSMQFIVNILKDLGLTSDVFLYFFFFSFYFLCILKIFRKSVEKEVFTLKSDSFFLEQDIQDMILKNKDLTDQIGKKTTSFLKNLALKSKLERQLLDKEFSIKKKEITKKLYIKIQNLVGFDKESLEKIDTSLLENKILEKIS